MLHDGIHEGIVSETDWELAHQKREKTGVKYEKTHSCLLYTSIFNVTFEPGCRNNWHIHHAKRGGGQILICNQVQKSH